MFVCVCKAISDKDIQTAILDGAEDMEAITRELGVGTGCGTCHDFTQELIHQTLAAKLSYAA